MTDLALGSLTAATSIGASDLLYAVIGGNSRKITVANFFTSPTLVTPVLGVAIATSLAIGGATIGTNALAVTGTISAVVLATTSAATWMNVEGFYATDGATPTAGNKKVQINQYNGVAIASDMPLKWSSGLSANTGFDTQLSRQTAGVSQFGTTSNNAAGSWLATSAGLGPTPAISASTMLNFSAGTTAASQFRLAASTAPTSPVNGDVWFDGTDLKIRIAGATKTVTVT